MITVDVRPVYRAKGGKRGRLTLMSACKDAARAIVHRMAENTGDDFGELMDMRIHDD